MILIKKFIAALLFVFVLCGLTNVAQSARKEPLLVFVTRIGSRNDANINKANKIVLDLFKELKQTDSEKDENTDIFIMLKIAAESNYLSSAYHFRTIVVDTAEVFLFLTKNKKHLNITSEISDYFFVDSIKRCELIRKQISQSIEHFVREDSPHIHDTLKLIDEYIEKIKPYTARDAFE